ncbi:MAG: T9SS type A sorting domain-containing protein [Bacteroidota bacterium]
MRILFFFLLLAANSWGQQMIGESIEHDPISNRFFTSSDNTSIVQRAADGTVSYFGSDLEANLGMEVMGNTLFAVSGSRLKGYDLDSELEVFDVFVSGAGFLNGLSNDGVDRLWVTDFSNQRIYEIDASDFSNPIVSTVVSDTQNTPNGIVYDSDNNRLIYVTWSSGDISAVDLDDYSISNLTSTNLSNMDGIDEDNEGNYYVSSWNPLRITRFSNDFSSSEIITAPGINTPADICYAKTIDTLAIPSTSIPAIFIGFGTTNIEENRIDAVSLFPNPVADIARLRIEQEHAMQFNLNVLNIKGQVIRSLGQMKLTEIQLDMSALESGPYLLEIANELIRFSYPFVKR